MCALLGHARIDTTQIYTKIRASQVKRAVALHEDAERRSGAQAPRVSSTVDPGSRNIQVLLKPGS